MLVDFDVRDNRRWTSLLEKVLLWTLLMLDLFLRNTQLLASQDVKSGVDYCDVFISCLDSHSDGTHSLQKKIGEQVM